MIAKNQQCRNLNSKILTKISLLHNFSDFKGMYDSFSDVFFLPTTNDYGVI